jgi:hypothetical protein
LGYVRRGWVIELICRKVLKKKGMDKIEWYFNDEVIDKLDCLYDLIFIFVFNKI